jgi:hypothetical protein
MLASASSIKSGIDLVPGDSITMGDLDWPVQDIHQVGSRAVMVHIAPFTQVFRIVCYPDTVAYLLKVSWSLTTIFYDIGWLRNCFHSTLQQPQLQATTVLCVLELAQTIPFPTDTMTTRPTMELQSGLLLLILQPTR